MLYVERWQGAQCRRIIFDREETLTARGAVEAGECLKEIERDRKRLRQSDEPWTNGWIGFLSYDLGLAWLSNTSRPARKRLLPLLRFHRVKKAATAQGEQGRTPLPSCRLCTRSDSRKTYIQKICAIQAQLRRGNAYEVNLAQRWDWEFDEPPDAVGLFSRIGARMRPRYGFLDQSDGYAVMGFSPELFFSVKAGRISAEPIKGTAKKLEKNLLRSEKDRAELLMITDLFRNDLGKVCAPGTIRTDEPRELELPYARHLFSRVDGRLRSGVGLADILHALFPSGSVTGAPKIAACGIIDRLEAFAREEAFGAVGWIGKDGMEFAVSIRTALLHGRSLRYTAGGGITVYSDPAKEYEETLLKSRRFAGSLPVRGKAASLLI